MHGADILMITTGAEVTCTGKIPIPPFGKCTHQDPRAINFVGTKNQVEAFAQAGGDISSKFVVYMSALLTTDPSNPFEKFSGHAGFYNLNAEAFVMASGVPFMITKACGLGNGKGMRSKLLIGHDGSNFGPSHLSTMVQRADVARVMVESARNKSFAVGLRYDLCARAFGRPTTDIVNDVFKVAMYPWDPRLHAEVAVVV